MNCTPAGANLVENTQGYLGGFSGAKSRLDVVSPCWPETFPQAPKLPDESHTSWDDLGLLL